MHFQPHCTASRRDTPCQCWCWCWCFWHSSFVAVEPQPSCMRYVLHCCPQTHKTVRELCKYTDLRTACLVGGDSMETQFEELAGNPDIIVATPGKCTWVDTRASGHRCGYCARIALHRLLRAIPAGLGN